SMLAVLTPGCLDSLGMGALMAAIRPDPAARVSSAIAAAAGSSLLPLLVAAASTPLPLPLMAIKQTLQAAVFAWIVMGAAYGFEGPVGRALSAGAVVYVGKISHGLYLAHGFAGEILGTFGVAGASLPEPLRLFALAGVTFGAASLS